MRVISLGWGVQSFTLAAMAALGDIEPVDYAIHADTTHESILTYQFARRWTGWLDFNGVKVVTVKPKRADPLDNGYGQEDPPYFSLSKNGDKGQGKRQCTTQWKINNIRRWLQSNRNGEPVEQLIGISLDEFQRMRDSDVKYITNSYPLIDLKMSRIDCMRWLDEHGLEIPSKSACYFCPYHSTREWNRVKKTSDWEKVVELDKMIRNMRSDLGLRLYLHPSRKPIDEVDFRSAEEKGQMTLWDNECSGVCGV